MSQAGINNTSSGPVPPEVPTQFTTDDGSIAIPVANNLNVLSVETSANNLSGIQTRAVAPNSDNLFVELTNRVTGAISTNDASPTATGSFTLAAVPTVYIFEGRVTAHDITDAAGAGYFFTAAARTDGAVATLISTPDFATKFEETPMENANVEFQVSGNTVRVVVTGIAGKVISWLAQYFYSQVI